jgi:hypothetical protein
MESLDYIATASTHAVFNEPISYADPEPPVFSCLPYPPRMRTHPTAFFALSLLFLGGCASNHAGSTQNSQVQTINGLSSAEARDGWRLLFDGKTFNGWRGYKTQDIPGAWKIQDGTLVVDSKATGADEVDLITKDMYRNFDLIVDWKVAPGANS